MNWQRDIESAETMLHVSRIPSSLEIITLIKKVNPTKLCLSEPDRERGYEVKAKLQNLLLENYGETFYLAPHPLSENIVLIKHTALPSIDACHAELASLSVNALDTVAVPAPRLPVKKAAKQPRKGKGNKAVDDCSPTEAVKNAQKLLEEYEYAEAEAVLAGIRVTAGHEVDILEKGVRMLVQEMGAYERAIETLLAQPKQIFREKNIRELLALTYYHNGMLPEARAIFDSRHPDQLGKDALFAYADLSFKDGNLSLAFQLISIEEDMEGYVAAPAGLKKDVEAGLLVETEPVLQRALAALELGELDEANSLAHDVLQHYPGHQKAREIVSLIGSSKEATEIARLWEKYARAVKSEEKTDLLAKLLDRDRDNLERIKVLMTEEKAGQKKKLVVGRLDELRSLAARGNWPECYPILHWLSTQKEHCEEYREACSLSAYFSVLYRNSRLRMLPERTAKELWLEFVKAKSSLASGQQKGCFQIMEGIKEYFLPCPEFREDYLMLLGIEQERAREEIGNLMQQAETAACTVSQIDRVFSRIRTTMAVLPDEERSQYRRKMEARLDLLKLDTRDTSLEAYREALLIGNARKAALLREKIADKTPLEEIDAEISRLFTIESKPVTVRVSDDLPVDLISAMTTRWQSGTDRHLIFAEHEDSMVVVNLEEMTATRFTSNNFKNLYLSDAISGKDTFLFRDYTQDRAWRAELSSSKSAFTATFDIPEKLCLEEEEFVLNIYLSSEKVTDYYSSIIHKERSKPGRVTKQSVGSKKGVRVAVQIKDQPHVAMRRASCDPDRFIIGVEDETRMCNKNLTTEVGVGMTPLIWEVDEAAGHIYYFYSTMLKRVDFGFDKYEEFPQSQACFFFQKHRVLGICPAVDTVLVGLGERCAFYNYSNNKISSPFTRGSVICTRPSRKFYCFDYQKESLELTLRDITPEIGDLLEWEEAAVALGERASSDEQYETLYRQVYFGYQATEQEEEEECDEA